MVGKGVQPGIGRRMIGLAGAAKQGNPGREEDKEIERQGLGQLMQIPGSPNFGRQYLLKAFPALLHQRTIGQHPSGVDHTT